MGLRLDDDHPSVRFRAALDAMGRAASAPDPATADLIAAGNRLAGLLVRIQDPTVRVLEVRRRIAVRDALARWDAARDRFGPL